ncbi:MAG: hypothetical protein GY730_08000 [bacterium]|nr:hypothetical protein [bacterium]
MQTKRINLGEFEGFLGDEWDRVLDILKKGQWAKCFKDFKGKNDLWIALKKASTSRNVTGRKTDEKIGQGIEDELGAWRNGNARRPLLK